MSKKIEGQTRKIFGLILPVWINEEILGKAIYSFLGLVAALLMSILFVWPRFDDLARLSSELKDVETTRDSLKKTTDYIQNLGFNLGKNELDELNMAIPKKYDLGLIMSGLENVSLKAGVVFDSYEFEGGSLLMQADKGKKTVRHAFRPHRLSISIVGDSSRLIKFINLLEKSLPFSVISDLSLSEISKLFTLNKMTKLKMELTYFESSQPEIKTTEIRDFTNDERSLIKEMSTYLRPSFTSDKDLTKEIIRRKGSIFEP